MIENARRKCLDTTFEVSGCCHTPFKDRMFDVVTVCAAYHHFPDTKTFAKEIKRILKPQGECYLCRCGLSTNQPYCTGAHEGKFKNEVRAK